MVNPELKERLRARKMAAAQNGSSSSGFASSSQSSTPGYSSATRPTPLSSLASADTAHHSYANSPQRFANGSNGNTSYPLREEDMESRVTQAQVQLERLRKEQEEVEKEREALQSLREKQEDYTEGSRETKDSLNHTITQLEQEITEGEKRLEQCRLFRESLSSHLMQLQDIRPEMWDQQNLSAQLDQASNMVESAQIELDNCQSRLSFVDSIKYSGNSALSLFDSSISSSFSYLRAGFFFTLPLILTTLGILYFLSSR